MKKNSKEIVNLSHLSLLLSQSSKFEESIGRCSQNPLFHPVETINDIVDRILQVNVKKLKKCKAFVRTAHTPEAIHDMRVATRRLLAALETFKKIIPTFKKNRTGLKKSDRKLGKKRDLDVFLAFILAIVNAKSTSIQKPIRRNDRSLKQILSMLESKHYAHLIESLNGLKTEKTKQNLFKYMRNRIRKKLDKVLEIASSIDPQVEDKTLHTLRISIKKLRYVCEFFEPIFSKYICSINAFIDKTKEMQDILGNHQDTITGISMLMRYKSKFSLDEFCKIKRQYELKKKNTRTLFFKFLKDFRGVSNFVDPLTVHP